VAAEQVDQDAVINWLGPDGISSALGLHHGDHSLLRERVFNADRFGQRLAAESVWIESFDHLANLAAQHAPLQLSGAAYYHHVAVRGVSDGAIWIANSAPGYRNVWDTLNRSQFSALGSWRATWVR